MKINIAHLYPDLLNLYGDRGNIASLVKRLEWRGIEAEVREYTIEEEVDFSQADIVFLGGGSDREQLLVCNSLMRLKKPFSEYVENGGAVLAVCGGYQLLGHYYQMNGERVEGLGILDIYTESGKGRLIGNIGIKTDFSETPVVGFENHGGRTYIGSHQPLGEVIFGYGNNDIDKKEGVIYKNTVGTYLHGPVLPKNPQLCDRILSAALKNKDGEFVLEPLDDTLELAANNYMVNRFVK